MVSKLVIAAQKRNFSNTVNTRGNITYQNLPGEQQKTKQEVDYANKDCAFVLGKVRKPRM